MNCEQIEPWISAYQDGELDARRRQIVQEHLARCPDCHDLCREWEALARELRASLTWSDAPETLHARVMQQIPAREPLRVRSGRAGFWRPRLWLSFAMMPMAAAAAWLIVLPHSMRPAAPPVERDGRMILVAAPPSSHGLTDVTLPTEAPDSATTRGPARKPGANPATKSPLRIPVAAPAGQAHSRLSPGRPHLETEWQRQIRQLRRPRRRYPVAELVPPDWMPRRRHRREPIVRRLEPAVRPPVTIREAAAPRVTVVDYVLPQVEPQLPAAEAGTDFVLQPAAPEPASDSGVAL
jgi:hypothetical protein